MLSFNQFHSINIVSLYPCGSVVEYLFFKSSAALIRVFEPCFLLKAAHEPAPLKLLE